mmetsp:Transcript_37622/g.89867  ORF Transcript_37622/g.89867 Transcript_37622/m.89867 type:complete len:351 (-) Transcript_37622:596-1648(-)
METCGRLGLGVETPHRVLETAGGVHQGDGAILHGAHLWNAAGLIPGRHQEKVGARNDLPLRVGVEAPVPANPALPAGLSPAEHVAQVLFAVAHHDELHVRHSVFVVLHEPVDAGANQVNAFLVRQPPHEADDAGILILLEPQLALQKALAHLLPRQLLGAELGGDGVVSDRVPARVDTIEDARQEVALRVHEVVESEAALRAADLLRVGGGHSEQPIAALNCALGEVQGLACVAREGPLMQGVLVKQVPEGGEGEPQLGEVVELLGARKAQAQRIASLVPQIVDHVHATSLVVVPEGTVPVDHVDRKESCLPVVGDKHHPSTIARCATQLNGHGNLEGGQREQGEPEQVV